MAIAQVGGKRLKYRDSCGRRKKFRFENRKSVRSYGFSWIFEGKNATSFSAGNAAEKTYAITVLPEMRIA